MGYFQDIQEFKTSSASQPPAGMGPVESTTADIIGLDFYRADTLENAGSVHEEVTAGEDGTRTTYLVLDSDDNVVATARETNEVFPDNYAYGESRRTSVEVVFNRDFIAGNNREFLSGDKKDAPESLKVEKAYDLQGRVSYVHEEFLEGHDVEPLVIHTNELEEDRYLEYNGDGSINHVEIVRPLNEDFEGFADRTYVVYDHEGRVSSEDTYKYDSVLNSETCSVSHDSVNYTYDKDGNIESSSESHMRGDSPYDSYVGIGGPSTKWVSETNIERKYEGNVAVSESRTERNSSGQNITTKEESYSNGAVRFRERELVDSDGNERTEKTSYDERGLITERSVNTYDSSTGEEYSFVEKLEYDSDGGKVREVSVNETIDIVRYQYVGGDSFKNESVVTYSKNDDGSVREEAHIKYTITDNNVTAETVAHNNDRTSGGDDKTVSSVTIIHNQDGTEKYRVEKTYGENGAVERKVFENGELKSVEKGTDARDVTTFTVDNSENTDTGTKESSYTYDDNGYLRSCEISYRGPDGSLISTESVDFNSDGGYESIVRDSNGEEIKYERIDGNGYVLDRYERGDDIDSGISVDDSGFSDDIEKAVSDICDDTESRITSDTEDNTGAGAVNDMNESPDVVSDEQDNDMAVRDDDESAVCDDMPCDVDNDSED